MANGDDGDFAVPPNAPMGMRNNNPLNIKYYRGAPYAGLVGPSVNTDQGDPQMVFATPQHGWNAAYSLLRSKYNSGKMTPNEIIAGQGGWTPGNYQAAANVARSAGINPNDDIKFSDPAKAQAFMRALVIQEQGAAGKTYPNSMIAAATGPQPQPQRTVVPPITSQAQLQPPQQPAPYTPAPLGQGGIGGDYAATPRPGAPITGAPGTPTAPPPGGVFGQILAGLSKGTGAGGAGPSILQQAQNALGGGQQQQQRPSAPTMTPLQAPPAHHADPVASANLLAQIIAQGRQPPAFAPMAAGSVSPMQTADQALQQSVQAQMMARVPPTAPGMLPSYYGTPGTTLNSIGDLYG
jgi:hypothetical protein